MLIAFKGDDANEPLSAWIAESNYYPKGILQASSRFMSRFEHTPGPGTRLIITLAEGAVEQGVPPIILDIDAISEVDFSPDWKSLKNRIEDLHELVWDVFDTAKTPRLEKLLKEGSA